MLPQAKDANRQVAGDDARAEFARAGALARWADPLIAAALLLLPLLVLWRAALLRGVFYVHDVQYYFYPYHALPAALLARGELPLWNQYTFSGIPLLGDGQTAMFYPPNWLFFLLPGAAALNYDILLQFGIAGAGMYLCARGQGLWRAPALLAALAYMFGGFLTARVVHLSIMSGAALLPLAFLCVDRALRPGASGRWFAAAAGAVALQAFAGHPQVPVYTALALGLYALVRAVERWRAERDWRWLYRLPLRLAGVYVLGYGLAAIQLAPWVDLGRLSPRAAGATFDFVFGGSMAGSNWLLFVFPYLYGTLAPSLYGAHPLGIVSSVKLWEHSAYVGILPLGLAVYGLLGLVPRRNTQTLERSYVGTSAGANAQTYHRTNVRTLSIFLALLLIGALVFAAGRYTPAAKLIYALPVVGKLRDVERGLALAAFAATLLAAIGMQRAIDPALGGARGRRASLALVAVGLVWLPPALVYLARLPRFQRAMALTPTDLANLQLSRPNAALPAALALLGAALLIWWSRRPAGQIARWLAVALVALDMGAYAATFNPLAEPQLFSRPPDVLAALPPAGEPYRKATWLPTNDLDSRAARETLAVSWGMVDGVEDINGFNSLQPRRYTDYLFGPAVGDVSYGLLDNPRLLRPESPILSSLNVRYLLVPRAQRPPLGANFRQVYENDQVSVYENTAAYPRAYFAEAVRGATDPAEVLSTVTADGFDGRRLALVEADAPPALAPASGPASAAIREYGANRIVVATETSAPRLLVLSEMDIPGWRATVDGAPATIYRTNYLFRGVVVPAGAHTVTFEYRPISLWIGLAISALALVVVGWLVWNKKLGRG